MTVRTLLVEVHDADGNPVAGARVWLARAPVEVPDVAALTDAAGHATLGAPATGPYTIGAATDGATATADVDVADAAVTVAIVL